MQHDDDQLDQPIVNTNSLAFIALANEYCHALESARETEKEDFINEMLRLLPRIYIAATDISVNLLDDDECFLDSALDEDSYNSIRSAVEQLMGPDDVYLEVFEENMKYSDTPIAQTISESLADIFQVLFNFLSMVRDSTDEVTGMALISVHDDFKIYWSMTLCNVLRAINHLAYTI